jgi:hypothetical protein
VSSLHRFRVRFGWGFGAARPRFVRLVVGALSSSDSALDSSSLLSSSSSSADSDAVGALLFLGVLVPAFAPLVPFALFAVALLDRADFTVLGVGVASAGVSAFCERALPGRSFSRPTPGWYMCLSSSIDMLAGEEAAAESSL